MPSGTDHWKCRVFWGAVIDRLGKSIREQFAQRYYSHLVLAVHPFRSYSSAVVTEDAGTCQDDLYNMYPEDYSHILYNKHGIEEMITDCFRDGALIVVPRDFTPDRELTLEISNTGEEQSKEISLAPMTGRIHRAIAQVSVCATLKTGDLVLTPVPGMEFPIRQAPEDHFLTVKETSGDNPGETFRFKVR